MSRNTDDPMDPAVDEPVEDEVDTSQETDQGEAPEETAPATKQAQANDPNLLRAAYTQGQQRWAELRKGLGLPKDATPDDVLNAIAEMQQRTSGGEDGEGTALPPQEVLEAEARAEQAEWRYQNALFPQTAEAAREFAELARQSRDPEELTTAFYGLLQRFAAGEEGATDGAQAAADDSTAQAAADEGGPEQPDVGIGEGPAADSQTDAAALARLRGSGNLREGMRLIPGLSGILGLGGDRQAR